MRLALRDVSSGEWTLETRVRCLYRPADGARVTLVGCVHVGTAQYFSSLASVCREAAGVTLFELIASGDACWRKGTLRQLSTELYPTQQQRRLAHTHGLEAQLDCLLLAYRSAKWYVADLDADELRALQGERGREGASTYKGGALGAAWEVLWAGPRGRAGGGRRSAAKVLRALCWLAPAPEAALLCLDWAWRGGRPAPALAATFRAAARLDFTAARRLTLAQLVISGQADRADAVVIRARNEAALEALDAALEQQRAEKGSSGADRRPAPSVALLYGVLHMDDLEQQLAERGFSPDVAREDEWLEAWRAGGIAGAPDGALSAAVKDAIAAVAGVTGVMTVGGLDWIETIRDAAQVGAPGTPVAIAEAFATLGLYVARHAAIYIASVKWVLDYSGDSLFVDD